MARIFLDEMGGINQGMLGAYGLPVSPFSTEDYASPVTETQVRPTRTRRKQSKPKPKRNDGIIRNHDSVWDYKIQDGKLLTRRKTSDGKWYDITSNKEARQKIESFTGRSIGSKQNTATNQGSKQATTPKSNTTTTPSNSSQSQPSRLSSTAQTQQTARPVRNDGIGYLTSQFTPNAIPQNNGNIVQEFINNAPKRNLLSQKDLKNNDWHFGGAEDIEFEGVSNSLYADAVRRAQEQGNVLLDKNNRPVTSSEVNRYLQLKDYTPSNRMSLSDMALYQPQSENSTLSDIRRAQDFRRNREFDRQRNSALATAFGLPLAGIGAAEAIAAGPVMAGASYLGADLGGKLTNAAMQKLYGRTWDEISDDPNVNFWAQFTNPGRWIGGAVGGYGGMKLQRRMTPIGENPNGIPEFIKDGVGIPVNAQSRGQQNRTVQMLLDPTYQEPVVQGVAPGYGVTIPNRNISYQVVEPKRWEPEGTDRWFRLSKTTQPKKSVKTTRGVEKKVSSKKKTKSSNKGPTKREREKIVRAAYEQAYQ